MTTVRPRAEALEARADEALEELESRAEPGPGGLTWSATVLVRVDGDRPVLGTGEVGPSLYDGTAGIALVLAAAGRPAVAGPAARHALAGGRRLLDGGRCGLFDGAAGIALAVVRVGLLLHDDELVSGGAALARQVARRPAGPETDLIAGTAGTALALLELAELLDEPALVDAAARQAALLTVAAEPQAWGWAWPSSAGPALLGLGHGAAGVALALAEVAAATGDARPAAAAVEGFAYERGWYDLEARSWPDLRGEQEAPGRMDAWCHGAFGIGLTRLRLHALTGEPLALAEASAALQAARDTVVTAGTALRDGTPSDCSACHGLAGAVELLLHAGRALRVAEHVRAAQRVASLLLEQRASAGEWPCGLSGAGEVPGLMTGTAGIALTLLRVAGAVALPSPLLPGPSSW